MIAALVVLGVLAQGVAWLLVRRGRLERWVAAGWVFFVLGVASALSGKARLWSEVGATTSLTVGVASAVVLFALTRLFLRVARGWSRFASDTAILYEERDRYPLVATIVVAALIAAGEELFWRGVVRGSLVGSLGSTGAAGAALCGYAAVSLAASSAPIVVASIVCGAAWSALAVWSHGIGAPIACHALWTGMMIAFPPTIASPKNLGGPEGSGEDLPREE